MPCDSAFAVSLPVIMKVPCQAAATFDFVSVSHGILWSCLLWHLCSTTAPLLTEISTHPASLHVSIASFFHHPPASYCFIFPCMQQGERIQKCIQAHRLQRECVDTRSPLVQREVKLQAWFAQYPRAVPRVADTSFFLPWEEGCPATFKTEDSHLPQSAVLFSEVIWIGCAKVCDSGSQPVTSRQIGLWPHLIMKLEMRSTRVEEYDVIRGNCCSVKVKSSSYKNKWTS